MTGFVYAIESGEFVKIGYASDPVRRLSELNVGSPNSHRLLGMSKGTKFHENEIHRLAREERVRGEWFRKGPIVTLFLQHLPPYQSRTVNPKPKKYLRQISDASHVVDVLGGRVAVAKMFGVSPKAVDHWRYGKFPSNTFMSMRKKLNAMGLPATLELWNFVIPKEPISDEMRASMEFPTVDDWLDEESANEDAAA